MKKHLIKRAVLLGGLVFFMLGFLVSPSFADGGETFGTATTLTEGLHINEWVSYPFYTTMYWKVSCSAGDTLYVAMFFEDTFNRQLYLFDPAQQQLCANVTPYGPAGDTIYIVECQTTCPTDGWYYIKVNTTESMMGAFIFSFIIIIKPGTQQNIPGFEFLFVFFGFIVLLGVAVFFKNQK
ncbi:MAG: hypothetical protein ACFFD2_17095 [Promethearchaeota archaeon]